MKKVLFSSLLFAGLCFGAGLDTGKTQMYWAGFKFANKTAVKGSFKDVQYKFKKGESISAILTGATATVDVRKVVTGNPASEENLTNGFFSKFASPEIKVKLEQVMEGDKQGTILAKVTMNKKTQLVPMQYTIADGKLVAKGVFDLLSFKLEKAFAGLKETCGELHEGYTWSQVEIGFEVPTK